MISGSISTSEGRTREGPQGPAPRVRRIMESRQVRAYARSLFPRAALGFVLFLIKRCSESEEEERGEVLKAKCRFREARPSARDNA